MMQTLNYFYQYVDCFILSHIPESVLGNFIFAMVDLSRRQFWLGIQIWGYLCDPMYCPWNSPGQNTGVGSPSLLQGIFPTQGSNPGLLHCRRILYQLSHKGSPKTKCLQGSRIVSLLVSTNQAMVCDCMSIGESQYFPGLSRENFKVIFLIFKYENKLSNDTRGRCQKCCSTQKSKSLKKIDPVFRFCQSVKRRNELF